MASITTTTLSYNHQEKTFEAFVALPSQEKRPLVILCHAWAGRDEYICNKAIAIAQLGYVAVAIDMYGDAVIGSSVAENIALKKPLLENRLLLQQRLLAGYNAAAALPSVDQSRIACIGFGFGGLCALDLARSGVPLLGAVSIYGHFEAPQGIQRPPMQAKILLLHGYNDPIVPVQDLIPFNQEMQQFNVDWRVHLYGNTEHAFATPSANDPAAGVLYNALSASRAWQATQDFLQELFCR